MFHNQLTIDKEVHSFVFSLLPVARFHLLLCLQSELGLAVRLLPLYGSRMLLLLSSLSSSSPHGIALLADHINVDGVVSIINMGSRHASQSRERR